MAALEICTKVFSLCPQTRGSLEKVFPFFCDVKRRGTGTGGFLIFFLETSHFATENEEKNYGVVVGSYSNIEVRKT